MDDENILDEEFEEQAISALMDLGMTEDEAERQLEDYLL